MDGKIAKNVVLLNQNENENYYLTNYPSLKPSFEKFSPKLVIQSYIQNHFFLDQKYNITFEHKLIFFKLFETHFFEFQKVLNKMDTIQRQSIDQNLRKLTETTGFSDIFSQNYREYFEDIED